jgi:hypothetical protein
VTSLAHVDGAVTLVEGQTFCLSGRTGDLNPDMPHGLRERSIGQGMREQLSLTNYGDAAVDVVVDLTSDVDFADLFEVKEHREIPRERITCTPREGGFTYRDTEVLELAREVNEKWGSAGDPGLRCHSRKRPIP